MMRSMYSGVSGIKVHQTKMDVIGNNIANVNTVGYKAQRVTFSDVFSQTISNATSANDESGRGGTNAMQIGLGATVSSIDMLMTTGAAQRTDNPFDVMVSGDGFIVVGDASGQYYTKNGAFRLDSEGNLCIANGMKVQGWLADKETHQINPSKVTDINLFTSDILSTGAKATEKASLAGNLDSRTKQGATQTTSLSFYDSLGNYYSVAVELTKGAVDPATGATTWTMKGKKEPTEVPDPNDPNVTVKKEAIVAKDARGNQIILDNFSLNGAESCTITFNADGSIKKDNDGNVAPIAVGFGANNNAGGGSGMPNLTPTTAGSTLSDITLDLTGLTQYATSNKLDSKIIDGNAAGSLSGYSIGSDGIITATYSNGDIRPVAQVVVAEFDNAAGLEKIGDNLYSMTNNSGEFDGVGIAGSFNTGVLEMSNVDLASEFTDMIVTQRGYQANSRIITVSDELLQELTNLKR